MRSFADRIRHMISFEIIALLIVIPLGALVFDKPMHDIGVIGAVSALVAMIWNGIYNYGFDVAMKRSTGSTKKTFPIRILHTVLFELGLVFMLIPLFAWYLNISLLEALIMDISFATFYMVYALIFNWSYDRVFPLPEWSQTAATSN